SGHGAIMSMLAPALAAAVATLTLSPLATVTRAVGSASAAAALMLSVDDAGTGFTMPYSWLNETASGLAALTLASVNVIPILFMCPSLRVFGPAARSRTSR